MEVVDKGKLMIVGKEQNKKQNIWEEVIMGMTMKKSMVSLFSALVILASVFSFSTNTKALTDTEESLNFSHLEKVNISAAFDITKDGIQEEMIYDEDGEYVGTLRVEKVVGVDTNGLPLPPWLSQILVTQSNIGPVSDMGFILRVNNPLDGLTEILNANNEFIILNPTYTHRDLALSFDNQHEEELIPTSTRLTTTVDLGDQEYGRAELVAKTYKGELFITASYVQN